MSERGYYTPTKFSKSKYLVIINREAVNLWERKKELISPKH